jgi:plastocyanin
MDPHDYRIPRQYRDHWGKEEAKFSPTTSTVLVGTIVTWINGTTVAQVF